MDDLQRAIAKRGRSPESIRNEDFDPELSGQRSNRVSEQINRGAMVQKDGEKHVCAVRRANRYTH